MAALNPIEPEAYTHCKDRITKGIAFLTRAEDQLSELKLGDMGHFWSARGPSELLVAWVTLADIDVFVTPRSESEVCRATAREPLHWKKTRVPAPSKLARDRAHHRSRSLPLPSKPDPFLPLDAKDAEELAQEADCVEDCLAINASYFKYAGSVRENPACVELTGVSMSDGKLNWPPIRGVENRSRNQSPFSDWGWSEDGKWTQGRWEENARHAASWAGPGRSLFNEYLDRAFPSYVLAFDPDSQVSVIDARLLQDLERVHNAVAGSLLVSSTGGKVSANANAGTNPHFQIARMAVGILSPSSIVIVGWRHQRGAAKGAKDVREGVDLIALGYLLVGLGAKSAINLDGSGSASMIYGGESRLASSDQEGSLRPIVSILAFKPKP